MSGRRLLLVAGVVVAALGARAAGSGPEADAHPLGNATVNHYNGLEL